MNEKQNFEFPKQSMEGTFAMELTLSVLEIPFEVFVENIIKIIRKKEGKVYKLMDTKFEWLCKDHHKYERYELVDAVYLQEENIQLFNRNNHEITEDMQPIHSGDGTVDELKKTDGVIFLYTKPSNPETAELPVSFVFDKKGVNAKTKKKAATKEGMEINIGKILTGRYEYLIKELAEQIIA